jgi:uncharacterized coiled-coil protein SlyX
VVQLVAAIARLESDRDEAATALARSEQRLRIQAATIEALSERVGAQDTERDALHRLLDEASQRRDALQAERNRLMADRMLPDDGSQPPEAQADRAARLRAAVAALAADLVGFATGDAASAPEASRRADTRS